MAEVWYIGKRRKMKLDRCVGIDSLWTLCAKLIIWISTSRKWGRFCMWERSLCHVKKGSEKNQSRYDGNNLRKKYSGMN